MGLKDLLRVYVDFRTDVVRRRTTLWLEPDRGRAAAARIAQRMAQRLGWSAQRQREEFQAYDASLWEEESLLRRAAEHEPAGTR